MQIEIGFPGGAITTSTASAVFYDRFVSANYVPDGAIGLLNDQPDRVVLQRFPLLQMQMPITPGVSGGPVISDSDEAIGVIDQEPLQFHNELTKKLAKYNPNAKTLTEDPDSSQTYPIALAWSIRKYVSPGYGQAVRRICWNR